MPISDGRRTPSASEREEEASDAVVAHRSGLPQPLTTAVALRRAAMTNEPSSIFSGLARGCIRDVYVGDERLLRDGVILTMLGAACSVLTVYAISLLGSLV